jgi:hypothetical protein
VLPVVKVRVEAADSICHYGNVSEINVEIEQNRGYGCVRYIVGS